MVLRNAFSMRIGSKWYLAAMFFLSLGAAKAHGDQWSDADELFAARDSGRSSVAEARTKYLEILANSTTQADKIRAVSQLGRLAIFEGEMVLPKTDDVGRKAIFSQCFCAQPKVVYNPLPRPSCEVPGFVDSISPTNLGVEHPAYYYFHGICTAYWGEVAGPFEKLAFVQYLKDDLAKSQTVDTRFEGGGLHRLAAGIYVNPKAAVVQMYNPEFALSEAQKALVEAAYPGDPSSGALYYDNWSVLTETLKQLASDHPNDGFKEKAIDQLKSVLKEMDEKIALDDLPEGRIPEFKFHNRRMKGMYKDLTSSDWPSLQH